MKTPRLTSQAQDALKRSTFVSRKLR